MSRPRRLDTFDYLGLHRYYVTCCVQDRRSAFVSECAVAVARSHFLQQAICFSFAVLVYCFMPDHVHLLLEGTAEDAHLPPFVARAKQNAASHFSATFKYRLWQPGFHDRVLRDDESTFDVIRYTINNPVRAGLVDNPQQYPFWGSSVRAREQLLDFIAIERDGKWRP